MAKVSIIIPIYNVGGYLPKCLDSVLGQTFKDWEAICVDDGSTDNCSKIVRQYAEGDGRIKVYRQENQGLSIARRTGFYHANGDFLVFLDSDDWIDTLHIEKLYAYATKNNLDYVSCNISEETNGFTEIKDQSIGGDDASMWLTSILKRKIRGSVCTGIYRRSAIVASGARFAERCECPIMEDTFFNAGFFVSNPSVGHIKDPTYHYLIHSGTLSAFDGKNTSWWHMAITANESIISTLTGRFDSSVLRYRAALLKYWLMWADEVPAGMFLNYHPEIHWLPKGISTYKGNVEFLIGSLGFRNLLVALHRCVSHIAKLAGRRQMEC